MWPRRTSCRAAVAAAPFMVTPNTARSVGLSSTLPGLKRRQHQAAGLLRLGILGSSDQLRQFSSLPWRLQAHRIRYATEISPQPRPGQRPVLQKRKMHEMHKRHPSRSMCFSGFAVEVPSRSPSSRSTGLKHRCRAVACPARSRARARNTIPSTLAAGPSHSRPGASVGLSSWPTPLCTGSRPESRSAPAARPRQGGPDGRAAAPYGNKPARPRRGVVAALLTVFTAICRALSAASAARYVMSYNRGENAE
jgi:hypothetical protein